MFFWVFQHVLNGPIGIWILLLNLRTFEMCSWLTIGYNQWCTKYLQRSIEYLTILLLYKSIWTTYHCSSSVKDGNLESKVHCLLKLLLAGIQKGTWVCVNVLSAMVREGRQWDYGIMSWWCWRSWKELIWILIKEPWIVWVSYGQKSVWCSLVDDTMTVGILIIICS